MTTSPNPEIDTVDKAFSTVESSLRDVIERVLEAKHGADWLEHAGIPDGRLEKWKTRREEEQKRRPGGQTEGRLIHFTNLEDLIDIVRKNWDKGFSECFGKLRRFEEYAGRLADLRNPDAHSRPLLPFEEHLVLGLSGEIRQRITIFLSEGKDPEFFARIEEIRDNYGLRVTGMAVKPKIHESPVTLRPGDVVTFDGRAWDPQGEELEWTMEVDSRESHKQSGATVVFEWNVEERHIRESLRVDFSVKSPRPYSRNRMDDDSAWIVYRVLPAREHRR